MSNWLSVCTDSRSEGEVEGEIPIGEVSSNVRKERELLTFDAVCAFVDAR